MYKNHDNAPSGNPSSEGAALAVSYLRVSTKEQAEKGGMDEGYSQPFELLLNPEVQASALTWAKTAKNGAQKRRRPKPPQILHLLRV